VGARKPSSVRPRKIEAGRRLSTGAGPSPLLDDTLALWQRRTTRSLSHEDARQIAENVSGFFQTLLAWQAADAGLRQDCARPADL